MRTVIFLLLTITFCNSANAQKRIDNTKTSPFAYVCKIDKYANGKKYKATGFLIGENYLLTNAHVAHNADSLFISPGYSPELNAPFGVIKVVCKQNINTFFPQEYRSSTKTPQEDFALVNFDEPTVINEMKRVLNEDKPFFKIEVFDEIVKDKFNTKVTISGYPCFKFFELRKKNFQYYNSGFFVTKRRRMPDANLNYKLNTRKCNSGSPLWVDNQGNLIVVGIHKSGSGFKNQGVEITVEVMNEIKKWMDQE